MKSQIANPEKLGNKDLDSLCPNRIVRLARYLKRNDRKRSLCSGTDREIGHNEEINDHFSMTSEVLSSIEPADSFVPNKMNNSKAQLCSKNLPKDWFMGGALVLGLVMYLTCCGVYTAFILSSIGVVK